MVDQEISQHRAAEGSDERCHHRVSQGRAPLSQNRKCERFWTLPLKAIHASEDIAAAREKAIRGVIEKLRGLRLTRAAELVEAAVEETLSYYAFPEEHWRRIR